MTAAGSQFRDGGRSRRRHTRGYNSYQVRYGTDAPIHKAIARRLSISGMFISTNQTVFAPGTELVLELDIRGTTFRARGLVRHALKVEVRYVLLYKPGMGVELVNPSPELQSALATSL